MALLKWILALPFIVGAVLFALAHPESVSVTLNPFADPVKLPLYFVSLVFLGIGFILGALAAWLGMCKTRKERRQFKKEAKTLTKENEELHKKVTQLEDDIVEMNGQNNALKNNNVIDVNHA